MAKLRVGIIGTGGIANAHAGGYKGNLDKCELAAVCDVREDAAKAFAEKHGFAKVWTDYHALLDSDTIDCVSVCTPNFLHAPVSIEALQKGKHALCEKPMATSVADAERMKAEAEKSGKILYIGFNHRFIGNFHAGKRTHFMAHRGATVEEEGFHLFEVLPGKRCKKTKAEGLCNG